MDTGPQIHTSALRNQCNEPLTYARRSFLTLCLPLSSDDQVGEVEIPRCFLLQDNFISSITDALETLRPTLPYVDMVFAGVAEKSGRSETTWRWNSRGHNSCNAALKMVQLIPFGIPESLEVLHVGREWKNRLAVTTAARRVIQEASQCIIELTPVGSIEAMYVVSVLIWV